MTVVVVGGSLGGLRAAEQLRANGYTGPITVVGDEPHAPYNRPPLSKEVLTRPAGDVASELSSLSFRPRAAASDVVWKLGRRVVGANLATRSLTLDDGTALDYDGLVVASGLRPRRLPLEAPAAGRHVLRTVEDALALRSKLTPGARVVVVGAGFIGCEVAASARSLGCDVTVVEPLGTPMARALGEELGRAVQAFHETHGVRFLTGRSVVALAPVVLDDSTELAADVLVEAVGSIPNVEWLGGNGLDLSSGVLCDDRMRVEGHRDVVAVGDVARYPDPFAGGAVRRIEHWSVPTDTAKRAAATLAAHLAGDEPPDQPFTAMPSFWSDQYDLRIQSYGAPSADLDVEVLEGDLRDAESLRKGVAIGYRRDSAWAGVVLVGVPASRFREFRDLVSLDPVPAH